MSSEEYAESRLSRKRDKLRERELLQYYNPADHPSHASRAGLVIDNAPDLAHSASSPDLTLTALAQLCALRLNTRRCIISVLDRDAQYSLAESTRSLDLGCTQKSEALNDSLWIGCARMDKVAGLCESVVNTPPSKPGEPTACIVVPDLSKDDRFKHMAFVNGPPNFKFYVGMPITTKNNINIGSLCVMDEVPGTGISTDQQEFLAQISHAVMENLERRREAEDRKKVMRMSQGLAAFVDGKNTILKDDHRSLPLGLARARAARQPSGTLDKLSMGAHTSMTENGKDFNLRPRSNTALNRPSAENRLGNGPPSPSPYLKSASSASGVTNSHSVLSRDSSDTGIPPNESIDANYRATFARAANLLRESLNLGGGTEGVVFFDTAVGYGNEEDDSPAVLGLLEDACNGEGLAGNVPQMLASPDEMKRSADVLAFSTKERPLNSGDRLNDEDAFSPVSESLLKALVKQYPRGKLWTFDEDGALSSSEDELHGEQRIPKVELSRSKRKLNEDALIHKHFPNVRQLLFTPQWDSGLARWFSGCFCWATSNVHVFSSEVEGSFLLAFGNSIMAEVSRLASMAADKQKGDFIGSISHELRSPLHGILASAEFLSETDYDAFQGSLVNTIESCGRTLLDTINHILDFSKINTFERNWRAVRKGKGISRRNSGSSKENGSVTRSLGSGSQAPPLMNLYAITDVAAICEEVVEGVYAGQVYQYLSSHDISDVTASARGKTSDRGLSGDNRASPGKGGLGVEVKPVDIILDIVHDDYTFTAQPGALRRVIMNIFGNAMKYTPSGTISVKLSLESLNGDAKNAIGFSNERTLKLVVKDTGKGISSAYLRTRLFTPFSQESSLAPGTGLGLSIVKSIVDMLNGTIEVRSQVGQGTEITVRIPLMKGSGNDTPLSNSSLSTSRAQDDSISALRDEWLDADVALYVYHSETRRMLEHYITEWFGLRLVVSASVANITVVDEADLPALTKAELNGRAIVVLCTGTSGYGQAPSRTDGVNAMEFMSKPFGPFKLAKALRICLERAKDNDQIVSKENSMVPNTSTIKPALEHWTLDGGDEIKSIVMNGAVAAASSTNALMAIGLSPEKDAINGRLDYPFPTAGDGVTNIDVITQIYPPRPDIRRHDPQQTAFKVSKSDLPSTDELGLKPPAQDESILDGKSESALAAHSPVDLNTLLKPDLSNGNQDSSRSREKKPPWILIVDDNKINLRLLDTFMKKRKYTQVTRAENGRLAVQAVETHQQGFDIIFMDISMPVMDGFEATRAIREVEETRRQEQTASKAPEKNFRPALIIALTGLASSRDQTEAFTSGVDLFMSKPVSFKEVGYILDNWEERRDA